MSNSSACLLSQTVDYTLNASTRGLTRPTLALGSSDLTFLGYETLSLGPRREQCFIPDGD